MSLQKFKKSQFKRNARFLFILIGFIASFSILITQEPIPIHAFILFVAFTLMSLFDIMFWLGWSRWRASFLGFFTTTFLLFVVFEESPTRVSLFSQWVQMTEKRFEKQSSRYMHTYKYSIGFSNGEKLGSLSANADRQGDPALKIQVPLSFNKVYFAGNRLHVYKSGVWEESQAPVLLTPSPQKTYKYLKIHHVKALDSWLFTPQGMVGIPSLDSPLYTGTAQEHWKTSAQLGQIDYIIYLDDEGLYLPGVPLAQDTMIDPRLKNYLIQFLADFKYQTPLNSLQNDFKTLSKKISARLGKADFKYTYKVDESKYLKEIDPIVGFLKEKKGYCSYYATAMTLLFRAHGIPARFVQGFANPTHITHLKNGEEWVFYDNDAHAWVEAWNGSRWISYDPTPIQLNFQNNELNPLSFLNWNSDQIFQNSVLQSISKQIAHFVLEWNQAQLILSILFFIFVCLVIFLYKKYFVPFFKKPSLKKIDQIQTKADIQKLFEFCQKELSQYGWIIEEHQSMGEWLNELKTIPHSKKIKELIRLLEFYHKNRFKID